MASGYNLVPNVFGKTVDEAKAILNDAGFRATTVDPLETSDVEAGLVARQDPLAQAKEEVQTVVKLQLAIPPTPSPTITASPGE